MPTLGMRNTPWDFSLWGAGLDPNSSRSRTEPPPPPPRDGVHGATKGHFQLWRGGKKGWGGKKKAGKTPNPLRSPLPQAKKKGGGGIHQCGTPPPRQPGNGEKNPVLEVET